MKLLILGASDSEGTLLQNFADSWREQLRTKLPALIGEEVEVDHRRFYVHLAGPLEYLEMVLEQSNPDFVILPCTGYAFTTHSVGNRLRRVAGERTGTWLERKSAQFDRATAAPIGTLRDRVNYGAHWLAGHTVGREPVASYDSVFGTYLKSIQRLARAENLDAIIMGTTYNGPDVQRRLPKIRAAVDHFNRELRAAAEAHHFAWVDRQAVISSLPFHVARPDQMHAGPEIHAGYAAALIPLIVERRNKGS